ncbi:MAG: hypothetical protein SFY80_02735 [Verrucomicrobiota bacterium]|nr:hypothetical protein [Verrucomicrobiota bacterium]
MNTIIEELARYFQTLGADESQSITMAAQLMKRAEQIAVDEAITSDAALTRLLTRINAARNECNGPDSALEKG